MSYSALLLDHFKHPRNFGEMARPHGVGRAKNAACGDTLTIYLRVEDGVVRDVKARAIGCAAAIATTSATTELARGSRLEEAARIEERDVADALGGLPPVKMHCAALAIEALHRAIDDVRRRRK